MKKRSKVSIIVPVYNVEKYIKECFNSLINQTYANCEFIFINDGSTDNSYEILLNLKKKSHDRRVVILNKKNEGVSAARNDGIDNSTGDYLVFVDADDFLSNDYVEYMLSLIKIDDSDFAFSILNYSKLGEKQTSVNLIRKITSEEAIMYLLGLKVTVGCWNKIYKKDFIIKNNLKFMTNLFYGEGLNYIVRSSLYAKNIIIGNKKVYYYRKNNILSATSTYNHKKIINGEKSLKLIEKIIDMENQMMKSAYILHLSTFYLGAIVQMIENKKKSEYYNDYRKWKNELKKNYKFIIKCKYVSLYRKIMLLCGIICPNMICFLNKKRKKIIVKRSV